MAKKSKGMPKDLKFLLIIVCCVGAVFAFSLVNNPLNITGNFIKISDVGSGISDNQNCIDADSGQDYFTKATVSYKYPTNYIYRVTDMCSGDILYEYFCYDDYYTVVSYKCPNGCFNGACIK